MDVMDVSQAFNDSAYATRENTIDNEGTGPSRGASDSCATFTHIKGISFGT